LALASDQLIPNIKDMNDQDIFHAALVETAQQCGLKIDSGPADLMWQHYQLLVAANKHINLTRLTGPAEAATKHYVDSLLVSCWAAEQSRPFQRILDIGTGGGFPSIPLAIFCQDWSLRAIDGTGKKVRCVEKFVRQLGLKNCLAQQQRAEQWHTDIPNFDLILSRATGSLASFLKQARHLCQDHTILVCYKSYPLPEDELREANRLNDKYGFTPLPDWPYQLPVLDQKLARQLKCYGRK